MQVLLVAATQLEIAPFLKQNPTADVLITGVGVPATIYHICKRVHHKDYEMVLQVGIAGAITTALALGGVHLIHNDTFADIGIHSAKGFHSIFDTGLADPEKFPFSNGRLTNPNLDKLNQWDLPVCNSITVNTVTENTGQTFLYAAKYAASLESMEGAALHFVCLQENIPFLQLRAISNYVGERDKTNWKIEPAIANLSATLQIVFKDIKNGAL